MYQSNVSEETFSVIITYTNINFIYVKAFLPSSWSNKTV